MVRFSHGKIVLDFETFKGLDSYQVVAYLRGQSQTPLGKV